MLSHVLQTFCQVVCILAYFLTNFNESLPKLKVTENVLVYFKTVQMYEIFFKILTFYFRKKFMFFSFIFHLGHIVSSIAEKPEFNSKLRNWNWNRSPSISNATESEVLVTLGQTAYLHCVVGYLGDRQVCLFKCLRFSVQNNLKFWVWQICILTSSNISEESMQL